MSNPQLTFFTVFSISHDLVVILPQKLKDALNWSRFAVNYSEPNEHRYKHTS